MPSTRHPSSIAQAPRRGWKLAASRSPTSTQPSSSPPPNPSASAQPRRAGSSTSSNSPTAACASPNQVSSQPADTKPDPRAYGWLILGAMTPKTNQPSNPPTPPSDSANHPKHPAARRIVIHAAPEEVVSMGKDVAAREFTGEDRRIYREKVRRCLDAFARMLRDAQFDVERPLTGLEIELNLVDDDFSPAHVNADALASIADPRFQTELGQFNIEINVPPRVLAGGGFAGFEDTVRTSLNTANRSAADAKAQMVMIGILPTLMPEHVTADAISASPRYALLNNQIFAARGEDLHIEIGGKERLSLVADSITPEGACTSVQAHVQVGPEEFASYWNAAQAIAGIQLAVGANSPYLFGKRLWHETRIPLFVQATDPRPVELKAQGMRPRVWFGDSWITSVFDLFEDNVRYFPALLPICEDDDPLAILDEGKTPDLDELTLHNG